MLKFYYILFFTIVFTGAALKAAEPTKAKTETKEAEVSEEPAQLSNTQIFLELEKVIYYDPDESGKAATPLSIKTSIKKMKDLESSIQKTVTGGANSTQIKALQNKYTSEILLFADNYKRAGVKAKFPTETLNFKVKTMCEAYSDFYKKLIRPDASNNINDLGLMLNRAKERLHDVRTSLTE
jgi:hypothetical protein